MIVTDLAARGIDIPLLQNVIHYDFPTTMKLYIHRSGRTARAGQKGTSFGFLTTPELPYIHDLSVFVGKKVVDSIEALSNPLGHYSNKQKQEISEEARNEDDSE